jgi:hypothetical protein
VINCEACYLLRHVTLMKMVRIAIVALLGSSCAIVAAGPAPLALDSQRAISAALLRVSALTPPDSPGEFIPVAFARFIQPDVQRGWREYPAVMPGTRVEVDLLNRVLRDFQKELPRMLNRKVIDAYLILYQRDASIHLVFHDSDGSERRFVAARPKNLHEPGSISVEDFKAE